MKRLLGLLLSALGFSACGNANVTDMGVADFETFIRSNSKVQRLDVRTAEEFAEGHIVGAVNIDMKQSDFMDKAAAMLDKSRPVAVYCRSGRRSATAGGWLADAGYQVTNLSGGIMAWQGAGKAVSKVSSEVFKTQSGKVVKLELYYHASLCIDYDGCRIQVDPVNKGHEADYELSAGETSLVLVTHEHFDHFSRPTIDALSGSATQYIANPNVARQLPESKTLTMKNGDTQKLPCGITIDAVPAYNTTEGRTQFHPQGRDNGYILTVENLRIYVAGDTEDIPEMADVKDIDIAFLPCNQPYTMTPAQLVSAAKTIQPKVLYPYHYSQTDVSGIAAQLPGIDVRVRNMQ